MVIYRLEWQTRTFFDLILVEFDLGNLAHVAIQLQVAYYVIIKQVVRIPIISNLSYKDRHL
jgi:hypothetical protein